MLPYDILTNIPQYRSDRDIVRIKTLSKVQHTVCSNIQCKMFNK